MITVEIVCADSGTPKDIVEIYFDKEGLSELLARLRLIEDGKSDHVHLMSESWGLGDLDEDLHRATNKLVHHLQLSLIK